jgi:hypothetical protein
MPHPLERDRLARLLDTAPLARIVPRLAADTLHRLIRHQGLDRCGDVLAAATPEQVAAVLELDLWQSPGPAADERFDPERFGEWLDGLAEAGDTLATRIAANLDPRLLATGLSFYIRVLDLAACLPASPDDDEPGDAGDVGELTCEIGGYLIRARRTDAWDAILDLLVALDPGHRDVFHAVMRHCRRLSDATPEADGLDDLLGPPAQALHDLDVARSGRRMQQGYLTPADARAFLEHARTTGPAGVAALRAMADAHRQATEAGLAAASPASPDAEATAAPAARSEVEDAVSAISEWLADADLEPERPRALLEAPADAGATPSRLHARMEYLAASDAPACLAREREMAFLANALVAGCSLHSRPFSRQEASDAAVAVCNLGLDSWLPEGTPDAAFEAALPPDFLASHNLVTVFRVGWQTLYATSLLVADRLIATLGDLYYAGPETQEGLARLRRVLVRQRAAGTPWVARDVLDPLAVLDIPVWASLLGLMGECPVVPAALTAILEGRTGAISATSFDFIATRRQIRDIRQFVGRLPELLGR